MTKKNFKIIIISILIAATYCRGSVEIKAMAADAEKIASAGMRSTDERVRANAVEVISGSGRSEMVSDVASLLNDPSVVVRFAAAVAAGDMNYRQSREKLKQLTKDKDLNVVMASSYALCKMGEGKYFKEIEKNALNKNQTIRANAAMLMGKLGREDSLPTLYKIKDSTDSSNIAAFNATEAIAKIGDEKIYKKIWTMLISVYADDRYMGAQAMAALGDTRGANALITLLDDEILEVRLASAGQLGSLGDRSGKIIIQEYLSGQQPADKAVAERCNVLATLAIGQIGDEQLAVYLPKLLRSESPFVQLAAAKSVFMLDKAR